MSPSTETAAVRCAVLDTADGHAIGLLSLDRPQSLNALSLPMIQQIDRQLRQWRLDPRICAVWLDSTSDKAFCAGADLRTLYQAIRSANGEAQYVADFFAAEYRLDYFIHRYGKPVIAWLHGITMGGGIGLGCGASHRVVTETSQFAMPEISIGLFPDVGASWFLGRIPGQIGRYLGMTGARLSPADTLFAGFADLPIRHARKQEVIDALIATRWSPDRSSNDEVVRRTLLGLCDWTLAEHSELARRTVQLHRICNAATVSECAAAIHDWAQRDEWAQPHSRMLAEGSPTSAALAWELQRRLRDASLADVFRLEYAAALGCARADFAEGIRALIIDKDRSPKWKPPALESVSEEMIEDLLRPPWSGMHPLADL